MSNVYYGVESYTGKIICHFGLLGMKWGKRRWQYPDGRFTPEGKERYFGQSKDGNNSNNYEPQFKLTSEQKQKINEVAEIISNYIPTNKKYNLEAYLPEFNNKIAIKYYKKNNLPMNTDDTIKYIKNNTNSIIKNYLAFVNYDSGSISPDVYDEEKAFRYFMKGEKFITEIIPDLITQNIFNSPYINFQGASRSTNILDKMKINKVGKIVSGYINKLNKIYAYPELTPREYGAFIRDLAGGPKDISLDTYEKIAKIWMDDSNDEYKSFKEIPKNKTKGISEKDWNRTWQLFEG